MYEWSLGLQIVFQNFAHKNEERKKELAFTERLSIYNLLKNNIIGGEVIIDYTARMNRPLCHRWKQYYELRQGITLKNPNTC